MNYFKFFIIFSVLFFGTILIIIYKIIYNIKSYGRSIYKNPRNFEKPIFQTNTMFIGMSLGLLYYLFKKDDNDNIILTKNIYLLILIPTLCDIISSTMMGIGMIYLQTSTWELFRSSIVIFSFLISKYFLKRKIFNYMNISIILIIFSQFLIGYSAIKVSGIYRNNTSLNQIILSLILMFLAQIIRAIQYSLEEYYLKDLNLSEYMVLGYEGLIGFLITTLIIMPISQFIDSTEGNGIHEDSIDTFIMLKNNNMIIFWVILFIILIFFNNIFGIITLKYFSAIVLSFLPSIRISLIWSFQIIVKLVFPKNNLIGETWNKWSWYQLIGFIILFYSSLTYNNIIKIPFIEYKDENSQIDQPII